MMEESEIRRRLDSVTAELLSTYEELDVLSTVAEIAGSTADVTVAGKRILDEAMTLLDVDTAFVAYTDPEIEGREPPPRGVSPEERNAIVEAIAGRLREASRPVLLAPFREGAAIPHAPDAVLAVPLQVEDQMLGVICLGRRGEGSTFAAGDLKVMSVLGSSAASVVLQRKNLDLSRLTRQLEERNMLLQGLFAISHELASSLDLDRLLHALSSLPARALGFDRCAVLLDDGASRRIRSVTGVHLIDRSDPEIASLEKLLEWVAGQQSPVRVEASSETDAGGDDPPESGERLTGEPAEAIERARSHMESCGIRSMLAIPLIDDQGTLGVFSFESESASFIDGTRLEGATILAHQTTVALRNARLYGDLPLIGLIAPFRKRMAGLASMPRRRLLAWGAVAALLLAIGFLGRWDLRVPGEVTVVPSQVAQVSARVRGVITEVGRYREGDHVPRGSVLARLDSHALALRLNAAESEAEATRRRMIRLEAEGRAADLSLARTEAERWEKEAVHLRGRIGEATLRAPFDGILLTPRLEERTGELLEVGAVLCTLADTRVLRVEIAVREKEADVLLRQPDGGLDAALKFHAFPEEDYSATITHVRAAVEKIGGVRRLVAEGRMTGAAAESGLRPGMTGQALIDAGQRPIITLILRKPYRFVRRLIWL